MGRDGSGTYNLPSVYDVSAGDTIQPEQLKTPLEDLESTLNTARPVSVGGTGATTASGARSNLNVQAITRANDTTGSSNAYALSSEVALTSLTDGDFVLFVANHDNTGAATLNVDSLGAKDMQKAVDGTPTALSSGDIDAGGHYLATYDASVGSGTWIVHITAASTALQDVVDDTTPQLGGNLDVNGNTITSASNGAVTLDPDGTGNIVLGAATVTVEQDIAHSGDANNLVQFGTDTQDFQTGGSSRLDISDSGVRLGGANARVTTVLDEDAMTSDSATSLATQQSIKAYVDTEVGNVGGPTLATAQATTSGASVTFGSIPAGVNQIDVMLDQVSVSDAEVGDQVGIRIGDSGGVETTGYLAQIQKHDAFSSGADRFQLFGGTSVGLGYSTGSRFSGVVSLRRLTGNVWTVHGAIGDQSSDNYIATITGRKELSAELTQVEVSASGASFDNGQVSIQYQ